MGIVHSKKQHPFKISSLCLPYSEAYSKTGVVLEALQENLPSSDDFQHQLIVTPFLKFLEINAQDMKAGLKDFLKMAAQNKAYIAIGCCVMDDGIRNFSSLLLSPQGEIIFQYKKTHNFAPDDDIVLGDEIEVCTTPFGKIGFALTTDIYYWDIFEVYKALGADIIVWQHYPDYVRDHFAWNFMLPTRAFDAKCLLVCSMYASEEVYLTNRHSNSVPGTTWGQSMIINRNGAVLAGTGYLGGCAQSLIKPAPAKHNPFGEALIQTRDIFSVESDNDYSIFGAITNRYQEPKLPAFTERTTRVMVTSRPPGDNWINDMRPDGILNLLQKAVPYEPDIILFSEENTNIANPTTEKYLAEISQWAASNNCYVLIGGMRDETNLSIARLWDRNGCEVFSEAIYWSRKEGLDKVKVFDTDFARIGIRTCGDIFCPVIDRCLALMGAQIIFDPSWMWGPNGMVNEMLSRTRAFDNAVYIACSHFGSSDPGMRSFIVDHYGQILTTTEFNSCSLCFTDIDFTKERIYYDHPIEERIVNRQEQTPQCYVKPVPTKKYGYQKALFAHRRPCLYKAILKSKK